MTFKNSQSLDGSNIHSVEWDRMKEKRPWVHQNLYYSVSICGSEGAFMLTVHRATKGFHLVFPAVGKNILYTTCEHVVSLTKEAQALAGWESSELGSQFSVEYLVWNLQPEGLQVTISKSPPLAEGPCSRHSIPCPPPLLCLFATLICVYLSNVGSYPTLWIFLGYDIFPFFFYCQGRASCQYPSVLPPYSQPTALRARSTLPKKKRCSVNLLSWLHVLNCLPTFEWQQTVNTTYTTHS